MIAAVLLLSLLAGPPAPEELAALRIETQPGTKVIWEGVSLGTTGAEGLLVVEQIPPGRFSIELRKDGYRPSSVEIEVVGGRMNEFELRLTPTKPPPVARPPAATPAVPPAVKAEPPPAPAAPAAESRPVAEPAAPPEEPGEPEETTAEPEGKKNKAGPSPIQAAAAAADPAAEPRAGAGFRWSWFLALATFLAAGFYLAGRFRANLFYRDWDEFSSEVAIEVEKTLRPPPPPASWERPAEEEKTVSPRRGGPEFIEELKRREKNLDLDDPRVRRRPALEVIDADFVEIGEAEGDR